MCELLGVNSSVPADIRVPFETFMRRGGQTGPHGDGWGAAFYENRGCRTFHDTNAGAQSEVAPLIQRHLVGSKMAICHIRRANRGRVMIENTHPFVRELWGRSWTFAHNGQLKGVKRFPLSAYRPVGTTDSEHAFCWVMGRLQEKWSRPPVESALRGVLRDLAEDAAGCGVFNFLLSDSRSLYCFRSTNLVYLTRRGPHGSPESGVSETQAGAVTVIATKPLTADEPWQSIEKGTLVAFRDGEIAANSKARRAAPVRDVINAPPRAAARSKACVFQTKEAT